MNFSEMKDQVINGVKWYFNRNWNRDDVMNMDEISDEVHSTLKMNTRIIISMLTAYSFGSSVGFIFNYLFKVEQRFVLRLLVGITIGTGNLLYQAITTKDRREIYTGCLKYCVVIVFSIITFFLLETDTTLRMIVIHSVLILFMGYLVIYSQEILYNADFGDIDYVNCTFNVFFHFPGIMIHATRLYLQGEQQEEN
uniref:Bax inhibitor 1 n=1 Tax=Solanum tuberosum TaxID=4113 RepID=M1DIE4_SOLTU